MYKEDPFLKLMNFFHGKFFSLISLLIGEIFSILIMYFNFGLGLLFGICFVAIYFATTKVFNQKNDGE